MEFKKILGIGLNESHLKSWDKIDGICGTRVLFAKDDPGIQAHLDADCLLLKLGMGADKGLIDSMPNLKYIGMLGTGYGRVDAKYAATKGITVCNIQGYATEGVAELVLGLLLENIREISRAGKQARVGNYSEDGFEGNELKGKKFGVIGLGRIGRRVAELAAAFGCDVRYWSRNKKQVSFKYQDIDSLFMECDFISLHLEYNSETKGIINDFRKLKRGAIMINLSPMELVNISSLEKRLKQGDIAFILDHSDELSKEEAGTLSKYDSCVMYPPIGYTTKESTDNKQQIFADNMINFLKGKPTNKVN